MSRIGLGRHGRIEDAARTARYAFLEEVIVTPPSDGDVVAGWQPGESTVAAVRRRIPSRRCTARSSSPSWAVSVA